MRFFSRSSKRNRRGQGRRPNVVWKEGRNKIFGFLVHFDANSDEFNQLVQTRHIFLGGQQALTWPFAYANAPLQPHPSIVDVLEQPQPMHTNNGWEEHHVRPTSRIINWPISPKNLHMHVASPIIAYVNSFAKNPPTIENNSSHAYFPYDYKKGKKPMKELPSTKSFKSTLAHLKSDTHKRDLIHGHAS
jgi:hypothetical protein